MNDTNPYESPNTQPEVAGQSAQHQKKKGVGIRWLVVSTFAGAAAGRVLLSPHLGLTPSDPAGHSVGVALGGFAGFGVGLLLTLAIALLSRRRS